ncbi:hypothetical protein D3C78_1813620 [compost metagenome]
MVIATISMPPMTTPQLLASVATTCFMVGRWVRLANSSVSCRLRRSRKMNGMIMQPTANGTRQPHSLICSGANHWFKP